jgi:hypothetical protein
MKITKEILIEIELEDVRDLIIKKLIQDQIIYSTSKIEIEEIDLGSYVVKVNNRKET